MGLFGKKTPCAICGGKVSGLFPAKIEGQHICGECYGKVDLPDGMEKTMTLEEFKAYRQFREENRLLKEQFQITSQVDFGWMDDKFLFDQTNRLLCMDKHLSKTIFEGRNIQSFVIREDSVPLFEGSASGLCCYASTVHERVMDMAPQIAQFRMQAEMQRNAERILDRLDDDHDNDSYRSRPYFDIPAPFEKFHIEIRFNHPYWNVFTTYMNGPDFDHDIPDVNDYLRAYNQGVLIMEQLAKALMEIAFPDAPEQTIHSGGSAAGGQMVSAPAVAGDVVEEIQRVKKLMEQGIITEEEFTLKKRQLLGI